MYETLGSASSTVNKQANKYISCKDRSDKGLYVRREENAKECRNGRCPWAATVSKMEGLLSSGLTRLAGSRCFRLQDKLFTGGGVSLEIVHYKLPQCDAKGGW